MRIAVFGSTGGTGLALLQQAGQEGENRRFGLLLSAGWLLSLVVIGCSPTGPGPGPVEDAWGVNLGVPLPDPLIPQAFQLAGQAQIAYVRFSVGYGRVEPQPGTQRYEVWDALIGEARKNGLMPVIQVGWPPAWNSTAPPGEDPIFYPPRDEQAWADFVSRTVARYPDVLYWELWNEPDLRGAWRATPAQYARLLSVTYRAVHDAYPQARLVLGGLALAGTYVDPDFLEEILGDPQHPAASSFDIMNFHVYRSDQMRQKMEYVRSTLARYGAGGKPIWVTETGYPSDPAYQSDPRYRGPEGQAQWLRDWLPYLKSLGPQKIFWHNLFDSQRDPASKTYGLLDVGGQPKPAYYAYQAIIRPHQ